MVDELIRIQVADIVLSIRVERNRHDYWLPDSYAGLVTKQPYEVVVDCRIESLPRLSLPRQDKIFDSESTWALYRSGADNVILLGAGSSDTDPDGIALFDDIGRHVVVLRTDARMSSGRLPDPLQYPLGEVLMVCLLAQRRGLMVHACGIDEGGRGYLFAGNSTHGKSTMARLWQNQAVVLNDDRIVLREHAGRFWMYGTPWHGDYTGVSPRGVPLEKIFFLHHAATNNARQCEGVVAASKLLARAFPPLWDEAGMAYTLAFLDQLVAAVPTYDLGFVPEPEIVDFVRCVK